MGWGREYGDGVEVGAKTGGLESGDERLGDAEMSAAGIGVTLRDSRER